MPGARFSRLMIEVMRARVTPPSRASGVIQNSAIANELFEPNRECHQARNAEFFVGRTAHAPGSAMARHNLWTATLPSSNVQPWVCRKADPDIDQAQH